MHLRFLSWKIKNRKSKCVVLGIITHVPLRSSPVEQNQSSITLQYFGVLTVSAPIFKAGRTR